MYSKGYCHSYDRDVLYNTIDEDYHCEDWFVNRNGDLEIIGPYWISEAG